MVMDRSGIRIALTIGDPAGIGPEITASLLKKGVLSGVQTVIVGSVDSLFSELQGDAKKGLRSMSFEEFLDRSEGEELNFPLMIDIPRRGGIKKGVPGSEGGRISGRAVEIAAELARRGMVDAIVTGPLSKEALALAGFPYRGHTEMLSDLLGSPDCQMVMVAGELRILILTRDMPLADVPSSITKGRIERAVEVAVDGLREWWGIESPRIAVSSLNPHAGDGGVLGMEEIEVIEPALSYLKGKGYRVDGPFPADTLFFKWEKKGYDLYVAMYHDQGMIPFKMAGFNEGVNVTLGLPVIRTSVCHGTAYDIAGKRVAKSGSLENAFTLAIRCVRRRKRRR